MNLALEETIAAPPAVVFDVFTDLSHAAEHLESIQSIEVLGKGPIGRGTRFRETRVMFGRESTEELEITEFDPPRSYNVECESCGVHFHTRYTFKGDAQGTKVEMTTTSKPLSLYGKIMGPVMGLMMKGAMKKAMTKDHEGLKAECERRAASGGTA